MLLDRSSESLKVPPMGSTELERKHQCSTVDPIFPSPPPDVQTKETESSPAETVGAAIHLDHNPLLNNSPNVVELEKVVESSSPKSLLKHVSPLSFKRIISSLVPTGADISDWKLMNETKLKDASHSAPQPTTVVTTVVDVAPSNSYPENHIREQQQLLQPQEHQDQHHQEQEQKQEQRQQSVPSNPISQRTISGVFTSLSQHADGEKGQVHIDSSSCRPRSVVMGFSMFDNSEHAQLKLPQHRGGTKGKFFINTYESDDEEEEQEEEQEEEEEEDDDVLTLTNNAFALRLKRDSLPRSSGFRSSRPIPPSLPENDCGNVSYTVEYDEQDSNWDEDAQNNTPLSGDETFGKLPAHTRQIPQQAPRRSLLSSLLAQKAQPQPFLRSSRSIYQDLSALSTSSNSSTSSPQPVPNASRKAEQALRQSHIAPIRSPNTTRRDMLCSELSESLRRNLLHERQHSNLPYPNITSKSSNDINALRGRYAEPQAGLNMTPTSTVFSGGDKHLGWFESFRGW